MENGNDSTGTIGRFLVTNMMIQLSPQALDPAKHVHGGVEHIVCTLHEPYSTLLEPIIHIDHSL